MTSCDATVPMAVACSPIDASIFIILCYFVLSVRSSFYSLTRNVPYGTHPRYMARMQRARIRQQTREI